MAAATTGADPAPRLVLSTGRTGSTLLREYLRALPLPLEVAFEPHPSRRDYILHNALTAFGLSTAMVHRDFLRAALAARAATPAEHLRIEMHAYLAPMITELAEHYRPLRIAQLVRHPCTWITSIANFGAAGWRRTLVDRLPFTRHDHPAARPRWRSLSAIERHAWHWRYTNERILALRDEAEAFALVRYEDLVGDGEAARDALDAVLRVLLDPLPLPEAGLDRGVRHNPSRAGTLPDWRTWDDPTRDAMLAICEPLLGALGYGPEPP